MERRLEEISKPKMVRGVPSVSSSAAKKAAKAAASAETSSSDRGAHLVNKTSAPGGSAASVESSTQPVASSAPKTAMLSGQRPQRQHDIELTESDEENTSATDHPACPNVANDAENHDDATDDMLKPNRHLSDSPPLKPERHVHSQYPQQPDPLGATNPAMEAPADQAPAAPMEATHVRASLQLLKRRPRGGRGGSVMPSAAPNPRQGLEGSNTSTVPTAACDEGDGWGRRPATAPPATKAPGRDGLQEYIAPSREHRDSPAVCFYSNRQARLLTPALRAAVCDTWHRYVLVMQNHTEPRLALPEHLRQPQFPPQFVLQLLLPLIAHAPLAVPVLPVPSPLRPCP